MTIEQAVTEAVELVFAQLNDKDTERFESLCRDAGLLWRCRECGCNVALNQDKCGECGAIAWNEREKP